jgi:taurine dioxygenase
MSLTITASGQACGATITGINLCEDLSPDAVAEIRAAWIQHQVLAFPDQPMDDDDLERFALKLGQFGEDPFFAPLPGRDHIAQIRREADETTSLFAEAWHSDWSFLPKPPVGTMLHGRVIPPVGGDTLFSNQYATFEALDSDLQTRLRKLNAWHSAALGYAPEGSYGDKDKGRSMSIRPSVEARKRTLKPVVHRHPESGREALFVNMGYTVALDGLDEDEAGPLLGFLFQHQMKPEFLLRQSWQANQLLLWDNRCLNHRATGGYEGHQRILHRITIAN